MPFWPWAHAGTASAALFSIATWWGAAHCLHGGRRRGPWAGTETMPQPARPQVGLHSGLYQRPAGLFFCLLFCFSQIAWGRCGFEACGAWAATSFQRQATPSWGEKTQPKGLAWSLQCAWGSGHRARGRWAAKLHSAGQVTVPRARCQGPAKGPGTQLRARALAAGAQRFAPWRHSAKARLQLCKGSINCALSIFQAPGRHSPGRFALLLVFI